MKPEAILFDLDNTLFDRDQILFDYISERFAGKINHPRISLRQAWNMVRDQFQGSIRLADFHVEFDEYMFEKLKPRVEVNLTLEKLSKNTRLAVFTNGTVLRQRRKLDRLGVSKFFHSIFISKELGAEKPTPEAMAMVLADLELSPGNGLMVGDDPYNDILFAQSHGMPTCWVATKELFPNGEQPDYMIGSVVELLEIVEC